MHNQIPLHRSLPETEGQWPPCGGIESCAEPHRRSPGARIELDNLLPGHQVRREGKCVGRVFGSYNHVSGFECQLIRLHRMRSELLHVVLEAPVSFEKNTLTLRAKEASHRAA